VTVARRDASRFREFEIYNETLSPGVRDVGSNRFDINKRINHRHSITAHSANPHQELPRFRQAVDISWYVYLSDITGLCRKSGSNVVPALATVLETVRLVEIQLGEKGR
jgi:hypothetical protein